MNKEVMNRLRILIKSLEEKIISLESKIDSLIRREDESNIK